MISIQKLQKRSCMHLHLEKQMLQIIFTQYLKCSEAPTTLDVPTKPLVLITGILSAVIAQKHLQ